jgi:hypothetical protein
MRIQDVYLGSKFFPSRILDPGSASRNLSVLTQKIVFKALGNMIGFVHPGSGFQIRIRIFYPSRIPDQGVKKGTRSAHCEKVIFLETQFVKCNLSIKFSALFENSCQIKVKICSQNLFLHIWHLPRH